MTATIHIMVVKWRWTSSVNIEGRNPFWNMVNFWSARGIISPVKHNY